MEQAFEEAVQNIIKVQADTVQNVRILQAENERLRKRITELEQQRVVKRELNTTVTVAVASSGGSASERPHKLTKMIHKSLHPGSAIQRLVQTASPRPPNADEEGEDEEDFEDGEDIGDDGDESEGPPGNNNHSAKDGKARFKLIAHSGDEREKICPRSREITIPVLVKSYVEFEWKERPRRVLVMMRPGDDFSTRAFVDIIQFLWERGMKVLVETGSEQYLQDTASSAAPPKELTHARHEELHKYPVDFVVTLGGDGTFIRAAYAFPHACPPILAFAFGSLGFLTPFPASAISDSLSYVLDGGYGLRLRARLEVEVHRENQPTETFQVLNECVVDRGSTSSLVRLMLYSSQNGRTPVTTVQGDGLIIATPTGSTAYSLSAGGSMVHPSVPAILVTPICPHSLSFRPILVPDSASLRVQVAAEARNSAWLSIDGRKSIELKRLDELVVRFSSYPVPAVMPRRNDNGDSDGWLASLRTALNWNVIQAQKPLNLSTVKTPLVEPSSSL